MESEDYLNEKYRFVKMARILANKGAQLNNAALNEERIVIFSKHRFYKHLVVELAKPQYTTKGELKNPIDIIDPLEMVWNTEHQQSIKFFTAISKFRNNYESSFEVDLPALKAIIANPLQLQFYRDLNSSGSLKASSLQKTQFKILNPDFEVFVDEREDTFEVLGYLSLNGIRYSIGDLQLVYQYFIESKDHLYLIDDAAVLGMITFFKEHQNNLVIARSDYEDFERGILEKVEKRIKVNYAYLKKASNKQLTESGFDLPHEQIIYLSESGEFVELTPVMKYGVVEIPILSKRQIKAKDKRGKSFTVSRDPERELQFITYIAKMHPFFQEQLEELSEQIKTDYFYIHRKYFLEPEWFLNAFEAWRSRGIAILGFNSLKNNKISPHPAKINIQVISGVDWFETAIKVQFNDKELPLRNIHKSIRNKSKFVQLDDGTMGMLPEEWLRKFEALFASGEVVDEKLRTPNISYQLVSELYDEDQLSLESKLKIREYQSKFKNFKEIESVEVPSGLQTTLRPYQKEGLNWLCFLDHFNFGGCLADDMGLGKTVQILSFILKQQTLSNQNVNLIVVPASLVFNWRLEIQKFAPSLKVLTLYGPQRLQSNKQFNEYQIILTSYGTLLSDVYWLKEFRFNYIFLDESQWIKNPDSQRFKAVRLLNARNRVTITGTPIENNTFDLYSQFAFACPGLLGNREQFKQLFSVPIDQFKDKKRSEELQQRIHPFLLRRSKEQVANELPDKTETVIYCEMGAEQREIYESCRKDIREQLLGLADDELNESSMLILKGITRLRQICNSPAILGKEKYFGKSSAKLDVLIEQLRDKAPSQKILVFSQFVSMLNLIKQELNEQGINYVMLTGQTKNREKVVQEFQHQDEVRVFLISLKAGGLGLNLTAASYVYLVDPWWNPAVEQQAIDRSYRIGQHQNVIAVRLICPDTIEEKIMSLQFAKKGVAEELIKLDESTVKSLSKAQLLNLI